jgi:hypothetical protein
MYLHEASPAQRAASNVLPLFRFDCQAGCGTRLPFVCHIELTRALQAAIQLAATAARKLEAPRRDSGTVTLFRSVFGHDPGDPLPWPKIKDSGTRFAIRYRAVEDALRSSGTLYRCDPCTIASNLEQLPANAIADIYAAAIPPNEVRLCQNFWGLPTLIQAGVLLHEMFHLRFDPCFRHGPCETKRTNAYCYEVFALSLTSQTPEALAVTKCQGSPP